MIIPDKTQMKLGIKKAIDTYQEKLILEPHEKVVWYYNPYYKTLKKYTYVGPYVEYYNDILYLTLLYSSPSSMNKKWPLESIANLHTNRELAHYTLAELEDKLIEVLSHKPQWLELALKLIEKEKENNV